MRLRQRLLLLFALFAIVPLLAIGVWGYVRSLRALDALVEAQTSVQAERIARVLRDRFDHLESDLALLTENAETQRHLTNLAGGDSAGAGAHRSYFAELWNSLRFGYERITLRDAAGRTVLVAGDSAPVLVNPRIPAGVRPLTRPIHSLQDGGRIGELEVQPRLTELLRGANLDDRFGERGENLVIDRETGARIVAGATALPPGGAEDPGERRVTSRVSFDSPPWTVLATGSVDEFAAPFLRQRFLDLGLLLGVVLVVSLGFFLLLRRATRSLDQLAAAADRVGQGDLAPALPPPGPDEVGHLSAAFQAMAGRIREMLAQVEAGRQTAVLGRFAVELAHEIRNPLTSVKLNLQGLERDGRDGRIPAESRQAVEMALREIRRLDQALRTALRAGRPAAAARPYAVHAVLDEAIALLHAEAAAQQVRVEVVAEAGRDLARGDPEAVKGVLVNLLLNAIQAMEAAPAAVRVLTRNVAAAGGGLAIEVRVRDSGPGIRAELRERIFHPFFTTKEGGTGLGLSVALQTVQAMGGTLRLAELETPGAELVVTLPLDQPRETS